MQISSASCCLVTKLFLTLWQHGLQHARLLSLSSTISQSLLKYNFIEYIFICFNGVFFLGVCEVFMVFFIQDYVICEEKIFFDLDAFYFFFLPDYFCYMFSIVFNQWEWTSLPCYWSQRKSFSFFSLLSMMLAVGLLKYDLWWDNFLQFLLLNIFH